MFNRMLEAAHYDENTEVERAKKLNTFNSVTEEEISHDAFHYFIDKKKDMEVEFYDDLEETGFFSTNEIDTFCDAISIDWVSNRNGSNKVMSIRASIKEYLSSKKINTLDVVNNAPIPSGINPMFEPLQIEQILKVNYQMLFNHIYEWKKQHTDNLLTTNDIYLHRGLNIKNIFQSGQNYKENGFISSYSSAISVGEMFARQRQNNNVIVSGEISLFDSQILFFSPFIRGMKEDQFEFGIIPKSKPYSLFYCGEHSGMHEYLLDALEHQKELIKAYLNDH